MWDRIDQLLERAPHEQALRLHRVELLEVRRRRANGVDLGTLSEDAAAAVFRELAVIPLLTRARDAWDGPLVVHKGPELSLGYPERHLRPFGDLDLLTDDACGAQRALVAAGFVEVDGTQSEHHLRALQWPGLPLNVEIHSRTNWAHRIPAPRTEELVEAAVPSRLGVEGLTTLAPAQHVLVLAAHAWSHDHLGRLGNLIDVAVALERADEAEVAALARRWGCARMWRATRTAIGALIDGTGRSVALATWARHLRDVRDRSVLEWHVKNAMAPVWGLPFRRIPAAVVAEVRATAVADETETWPAKHRRIRLAVRNAGASRSEHVLTLDAGGQAPIQGQEAR